MKKPLIYVQEPNALKNWLSACETESTVLYSLDDLEAQYSPQTHLLLVQITAKSPVNQIITLAGIYDTIACANEPSDSEGLFLFQNGIKGYINTFATIERIQQAVDTVQSGNVWLGQSVMQIMIQALSPSKVENDGWKDLLTQRELETTELVLQSQSNKAIAKELSITERTVKAHLHNIFEKFAVNDRLSLVLRIKNWQ